MAFVDFQNLRAKISKRKLDGAEVSLEQAEPTDSVLVENLQPGTTPDLLALYFESRRGGDQKVKEVTMLSDRTAVVSFVNYECTFVFIQALFFFFTFVPASFNNPNVCFL